MTISNKITLTCGVLLALTLTLGIVGLVTVSQMDGALMATETDALPGIYRIGRAESLAKDVRARMLTHIASGSTEEKARIDSEIVTLREELKGVLRDYEKTISRAHDRELFSRIEPAFDRVLASWEPVAAASRQGNATSTLGTFTASVTPAIQDFLRTVKDEVDDNKAYGDACALRAARASLIAKRSTWFLLALSILAGGGLAFLVVGSVNRALRQAVGELSDGAEQVAAAAGQVATASQSLAQGASEQASSLEETSASTQEISSMTRQNADNSRMASEATAGADLKVQEANRTLEEMVGSMSHINDSSQKISKIIKVIDEIAFQTNILALNAAVEAARAGEAGMGFAVVADEVRSLAQRSAQAAKDTAALIEESVSTSTEGNAKLESVVEAIRGITSETARVKTLVDEVSAASAEQSRGMDQISKAVNEMEQVTQRNAASSEESSSASQELSAQAENVKQVVRRLRALVERER